MRHAKPPKPTEPDDDGRAPEARTQRDVTLLVASTIAAFFLLSHFNDPLAPVSIWLAATAAALVYVRRWTTLWAKAAEAVLLPALIGFAILGAALLFINHALPDQSYAGVARVELWLMHLQETLPHWVMLSWPKLVVALLVLIPIARAFPRSRLVSRFLMVKRAGTVASAALTVATSFTFFTSDAVLGAKANGARERVTAVIREGHDTEARALAKFVATKEVTKTLGDSAAIRAHVAATVTAIAARSELSNAAKMTLADEIGDSWSGHAVTTYTNDGSSEDPHVTSDNAAALVAEQTRKADDAEHLAEPETKRAIRELFGATLALAPAGADVLMEHALSRSVDGAAELLLKPIQQFLGKLADKSLEAATEHFVDERATEIASRIHDGIGVEARTRSPNAVVQHTVHGLGVTRPAERIAKAEQLVAQAEALPSSAAEEAGALTTQAMRNVAAAGNDRSVFGSAAGEPPSHAADARIEAVRARASRVHAIAIERVRVTERRMPEHEVVRGRP